VTASRTRGIAMRGVSVLAALASLALAASALAAADPNKVLRLSFEVAEIGFDPVRISDGNSATINEAIFERLLTYDYLARPAKLVPMTVESMPEVSDDGRTYTFRLRKGIYFTPDPAFKGVARELVAQDFVYSFMRFFDPKYRAPYAFLPAEGEGLHQIPVGPVHAGIIEPGRYTVHVWYPEMRDEPKSESVTVAGEQRVELSFVAGAHGRP